MTNRALINIAILRQRFDLFVLAMFRELHGRDADREPYLEPFCFALQQAGTTEGARLIVNLPPRHLKSECAAVFLPAWLLGHDPSQKIGVATYGQDLSREHTVLFRRVIESDFYRVVFPDVQIARGRDRQDLIGTSQSGGYRPITVGGSFTGMGVDVLVMDDLMKAQDQQSQTIRDAVMRFYSSTAVTRFMDQNTGRLISCMQRMHVDDIVGRLMDRGGYRRLVMPSIAPRDMTFECYEGRRWLFEEGALLSPERHPRHILDGLRTQMGTFEFSAQYLQEPMPASSRMLDFERLHLTDDILPQDRRHAIVQTIDTAVKDQDDCDYSVIASWAMDDEGNWHLVDLIRERFDYPALKARVQASVMLIRPAEVIIEDSHIGSALACEIEMPQERRRARTVTPRGSKEERFAVELVTLYSGRICFPRNAPWWDVFRSELIAFPSGRYDDIVDTVTYFAQWLRTGFHNDWYSTRVLGNRPSSAARRRNSGRPTMRNF